MSVKESEQQSIVELEKALSIGQTTLDYYNTPPFRYGNEPFSTPITHGGVIELDKPNIILEFGTGWYENALNTKISYYSPGN